MTLRQVLNTALAVYVCGLVGIALLSPAWVGERKTAENGAIWIAWPLFVGRALLRGFRDAWRGEGAP